MELDGDGSNMDTALTPLEQLSTDVCMFYLISFELSVDCCRAKNAGPAVSTQFCV